MPPPGAPAAKMKMRTEHMVPLSTQALDILRERCSSVPICRVQVVARRGLIHRPVLGNARIEPLRHILLQPAHRPRRQFDRGREGVQLDLAV